MSARTRNARFTPTLMFGETSIGTAAASRRISASWAASRPVVPTTAPAPWAAATRRWASVASGAVNSTRTRPGLSRGAGSSLIGIPRDPAPAVSPASRPTAPWPGRSKAPTTRRSPASRARAITRPPIRPAAPATTSSITVARRRSGSGPEDACLDERRAEPLPVGGAHRAHREAPLRPDQAEHRHRLLNRDRVRLDEHRLADREEPEVRLPRSLPVALERGMGDLDDLARQEVRHHRDDAPPADRHQGEREGVVAREHGEVGAAGQDHGRHLVQAPGGLLDADDVRKLGQALEGLGLDVDRGPALDVVDDEGQIGHGLGDRPEVLVEAALGRT